MSEEELLLQWLLAGGDPQAPCPNPAWRRLLRGDPFWRQLAEEIRRWDRQVGEQVRQGPLPEPPSGRLRQRVLQLVQAAVAAGPDTLATHATQRTRMPIHSSACSKRSTSVPPGDSEASACSTDSSSLSGASLAARRRSNAARSSG